MKIDIEFLPKGPLPPTLPKPFFSIVDDALGNEIKKQIGRPFWLDTVGRSNLIEIRIELPNAILRAVAYRSAAYASNSYIFILWMVGTSLGAHRRRHRLPAHADPADPAPVARRRGLRQGPRDRLPPARRARGAPGRLRLHRDETAHRAGDRAAHRHAERRQPRPSHRHHPLQALARADGRQRGFRRDEEGRRRDAAHAGGLSRLRARRCLRARHPRRHARLHRGHRVPTPSARDTAARVARCARPGRATPWCGCGPMPSSAASATSSATRCATAAASPWRG